MNEPSNNENPESTTPPNASVEQAPSAADQTQPSNENPAREERGPRGKKPFGPRRPREPREQRPVDRFDDFRAGAPKLHELDQDIEAELAAAMSGYDPSTTVGLAEPIQQNAPKGTVKSGQRHKGTVISVRGMDVFIEVPGGRSQGLMSLDQFDKKPEPGQEVEFVVDGFDSANGLLKLSKVGAAVHVDWSTVRVGQIVEARVTGANKGGLTVEVNGIRGFLPSGQVALNFIQDLSAFVNQRLTVIVTEANPSERNLVVSRKKLLLAEREQQQAEFWEKLEEGQIHQGTVTSLQSYGAFVNLGPTDALLPISEITWGRVGAVADIVKVGQGVTVKIIRLDRANKKISVSLKALEKSPWDTITERLHVGSKVVGKVTRTTQFGAFVELEPGIEGMVHISEIALHKVFRVRDALPEGKEVEVEVLSIDVENRRIALSLKTIAAAKARAEAEAAKAEMAAREAAQAQAEAEAEAQAAAEAASKPVKKSNIPLRGGTGGSGPLIPTPKE